VAKADLPPETSDVPLDFPRLIATLDVICGERVIVRLMQRG
jgi:hypothetical protein